MSPEESHRPDRGTSRLKGNIWALLSRDELTPTRGSLQVLTRCWILARAAKYKKHTWDKKDEQEFLSLSNSPENNPAQGLPNPVWHFQQGAV